MDKIKISLIINVNYDNYLSDCLESIYSQHFKDIEIILVDPGYYNLKSILEKEYNNKIITRVYGNNINHLNNVAIKQSKGKYILFMNSKDFLCPDSLKTLYENAEKIQTDILFLKSTDFLNTENTYQTRKFHPSINEYTNKSFIAEDIDKKVLFDFDSNIRFFYLNSFLKDKCIYFSENLTQKDCLFDFKATLLANKITVLDQTIYCNRILEENNSESKIEFNEFSLNNSNFISFFRVHKIFLKYEKYILDKYVTFIKDYYYSLSEQEKYNYYKLIKQELIKYNFITYDDYYENVSPENILFIRLIQNASSYDDYLSTIALQKNQKHQLLSVIMPIYNGKKDYIKKAFESVYEQSFGFDNIELIMVDDASTEKEGKNYIKELSDLYPNVKSIFLDKNRGAGNARNEGINLSSTDYIMFLDHDDTYRLNACEILFKTINDEDVDVVSGNYVNNTPGFYRMIDWEKRIPNLYSKTHNLRENPNLLKIYPTIWSKIFKKSFLISNDIKFKNFRVGQDLIFYQEVLLKVNSIKFIKDIIVNYSFRKGKSSKDSSVSLNRSKNVLKKYVELYYESYHMLIKEIPNYAFLALNPINGWVNIKLFDTDFSFREFKDLCDYSQEIFKLFNQSNKNRPIKKYEKIYEYIADNNLKLAYDFYKTNQIK